MEFTDNLSRADARLKLVKATDAVAAAMLALVDAIDKADRRDVQVLYDGGNNPFTAPGHINVAASIKMSTAEVKAWAARLHNEGVFERLGTKRWPDSH